MRPRRLLGHIAVPGTDPVRNSDQPRGRRSALPEFDGGVNIYIPFLRVPALT